MSTTIGAELAEQVTRALDDAAGVEVLRRVEDGAFPDAAWDALAALRERNAEKYEEMLLQALTKYPRAYQPKSLQGFAAGSRGASLVHAGRTPVSMSLFRRCSRAASQPSSR